EQVEQVTGQAEVDAGGQEDQDQGVVAAAGAVEVAQAVDQGGAGQHPCQGGHARPERADRVVDPDDHAPGRTPAGEPVDQRMAGADDHQDQGQDGGGERDRDGG